MKKKLETKKKNNIQTDSSAPRCLYQTLCAHTLSDILPEEDLKILDQIANKTKWRPRFFQNKIPLRKTSGKQPLYILMETGANFSEEYQEKTHDHFAQLGLSKTFLQLLKAAQKQMTEPLILSTNGCYAEPRTPPTLKTPIEPKVPIKSLLKSLEYFHTNYPIELLTNILNHTREDKKK
jgi:hypothetical protein